MVLNEKKFVPVSAEELLEKYPVDKIYTVRFLSKLCSSNQVQVRYLTDTALGLQDAIVRFCCDENLELLSYSYVCTVAYSEVDNILPLYCRIFDKDDKDNDDDKFPEVSR